MTPPEPGGGVRRVNLSGQLTRIGDMARGPVHTEAVATRR